MVNKNSEETNLNSDQGLLAAGLKEEKETELFLHDRFMFMQNADGNPASVFLVFEMISSRRYETKDDLT